MMRVADSLQISRSRLAERIDGTHRTRKPRYVKAQDEELLRLIRAICDEQTYGYRRMQACLNAYLRVTGQPEVNHKRVYRIMRMNGLLLTRQRQTSRQGA